MADELLVLNGIDPETGDYLSPPLPAAELAERIRAGHLPPTGPSRSRPGPGVDVCDVASAGWGLVLPSESGEVLEEALEELLRHRRKQARPGGEALCRVFRGKAGVQPGETALEWLTRHEVGPSTADPERVPFFLLLAGDPEQIPWAFQGDLGINYAVGRLAFDSLEEYACYAASTVRWEQEASARARRMALFSVCHSGEGMSEAMAEYLAGPLAADLDKAGWPVDRHGGEGEATKTRLSEILSDPAAPSLLFTVSHGLGPRPGRPGSDVGGLLCQDWPGLGHRVEPDHCFTADDVQPEANLTGLVAFHFACYSAGLPRFDSYTHQEDGRPKELAPQPRVSALPQRLLAHEKGAALAVLGHLDRARGYSFCWPGAGSHTATIAATLKSLLMGEPVGLSAQYLYERYASILIHLTTRLRDEQLGKPVSDELLADLHTAAVDARGHLLLGDPAVRLRSPGS